MSLTAQLFSTLYSFLGLNVPLVNENAILTDILGLETIVQLIELSFYVIFGFILPTASSTMDIAAFRYADWFFTTPMMILSTIAFMDYIRRKELPPNDSTTKELPTLQSFLMNQWKPIVWILLCNVWMLSMGLLQELGAIDIITSTLFGFLGFIGLFSSIWVKYAHNHKINKYLWYYMSSTWSIYGVAPFFSNITKNSIFNLLDIVSKNFYSVFLTQYILNLK